MIIYIIIFLFLFVLSILDSQYKLNRRSRILLYLIVIFLFGTLSVIRWENGTDWESYFDFFDKNLTLEQFKSRAFEPLFTYLNYLVKQFTDSYTVVLLLSAIIIYPLKSTVIWKYSPFPFFSLLLYYLINRGDIFFVRESIALSITFFSINYIVERKLFRFLLCIIIASLFHSSTLIFIFAYFIYSVRLNIKYLFAILISAVVISYFFATSILLFFADILGGAFLWKVVNYIDYADTDFGLGMSLTEGLIRGGINRMFFLFLFLGLYLKNRDNKIINGFFNLYLCNILIFVLVMPISFALSRLVNSYELIGLLLIGYWLSSVSSLNRPYAILLLSVYFFIRFYMSTLTGGYSECFIPFKTVFE